MTGWAILGTGSVARKFVSDLRHTQNPARAVVVASRLRENAERFAADLGVGSVCDSYQEAVTAPQVDAVYIATPPALHEAHAMMALAAGRAVLIEKPFAPDAVAARRIAQAAQARGLFCMEAMWTRFLPAMTRLRAQLAAGTIGEIRSLSGRFGISSVPDIQDSLFDPAQGGGALLHRGVYPLSLAHHLLGPVTEVQAMGRIGATGVDEDCTLTLRHDSGAVSTISTSLRAPATNDLSIAGTHGMLRLAPPIYRPFVLETTRTRPRAKTGMPGRLGALRESDLGQMLNQRLPRLLRDRLDRTSLARAAYRGNGYHYQVDEVARCLAANQTVSALMPPEDSVAVLEIIDTAFHHLRQDH